jgi:hypothetical protein
VRPGDVCFSPESGLKGDMSGCLLWAKSGLMQRSKKGSLFNHFVGALLEL